MSDPDARNTGASNDLFGNLPTASSPLPENSERDAPAPGSRRAIREAAAREAAAREAARGAATREAAAQEETRRGASDPAPRTASEPAPLWAPAPVPQSSAEVPRRRSSHVALEQGDDTAPTTHPLPLWESDAPRADAADPRSVDPATDAPAPTAPDEQADAPHLHELFAPERHHDVPKKRRGRGCLIGLIIMLVLLGGAVAGGFAIWGQYGDQISDMMGWGEPKDYEAGIATGEALVTIKHGDTGEPVSIALYEAGVTKTSSVFYDYLIDEGKAVTFYPGVYALQQKMTAAAALEALQNPENRMENTVRVAEGGTVRSTLPQIVDGVGIPLEDLQAAVADPGAYGVAADTLEGWLFPAVYTFDPDVTAKGVIEAMVARTQQSLDEVGVSADDAQEVLTTASIIQREGHTADFDKVSRVIANRLDPANDETHGLLQMDSTAQYGYGLNHDGPVASWPWESVVGDDNPWNTYVHPGLPASPIANPSHAAIEAAANPADGPWFYFVTVNLDTGETVFSATYAEQQAAEAQYRKWCEENPDGGCY
ncbi:endolytic transglycosylase MltG [Microbacterium esteraromaticum]|uniref:endolytic transglycosylase MltG n=1 Tax=Microbacterium esteraromaticum TaxID=57043 RepID=UPI001C988FAF|nr:endolytic transglycosylase MltG [Microbacterium esteraromaticum]MBY6061227.1 endolytic transglycosylase MltG [Microbacterium esteraromaticum]